MLGRGRVRLLTGLLRELNPNVMGP
jgi:hypothetical protein